MPRSLLHACLALGALGAALSASQAAAHPDHHEPSPEPQIIAQVPDDLAKEPPRPWTSLKPLDAEARFHFVVVSDRTGNHRPGVWQQAMDKIDLMQPAFVVSVGDLIEGYTEDRAELESQWNEIDGMIGTLDAPFFYVPGNHDYSNQVMADVWAERLGPTYYSFTYKETLFVVLNSALFDRDGIEGYGERGGDWAQDQAAQLQWLSAHAERTRRCAPHLSCSCTALIGLRLGCARKRARAFPRQALGQSMRSTRLNGPR